MNFSDQRESDRRNSNRRFSRRDFLTATAIGCAGLSSFFYTGCASPRGSGPARKRIAFVTANLVARFTNYRFELAHWGEQHQKTVVLTDEAAWASICRDIAACGFSAVEVWEAHAAPESLNEAKAARWKQIMAEHGLRPIGYAGGLRAQTLRVCQWLGIPRVNGGLHDLTPEQATALCRQYGVSFNLENHPEKSAAETLARIGGGNEWLGVCVDTGWYATQGANVSETIRHIGKFVRHAHIKDVRAAGGHETCLLGEGVANVEGCLQALREIGYRGWYGWEDEPEDRNPLESAVRNRKWIEARV